MKMNNIFLIAQNMEIRTLNLILIVILVFSIFLTVLLFRRYRKIKHFKQLFSYNAALNSLKKDIEKLSLNLKKTKRLKMTDPAFLKFGRISSELNLISKKFDNPEMKSSTLYKKFEKVSDKFKELERKFGKISFT